MRRKIYDIIGIGIGPFNLGLAALTHNIGELDCIFFDQLPAINWHPGLLLETARLQVPFYADLVSFADPTNKFSYLNFLHAKQRMIPFGVHQHPFPSRIEYNLYCQWVAAGLDNLRFDSRCTAVYYDAAGKIYTVEITDTLTKERRLFYSRNVVIGVGMVPALPGVAENIVHSRVIHSSAYLDKKRRLLEVGRIAVIGAGQSAAEIFDDLLAHIVGLDELSWYTRSDFSPIDYSAFALEKSSPDYIGYFFSLDEQKKREILAGQDHLYKGINADLLAGIYEKLYMQRLIGKTTVGSLYPKAELRNVGVLSGGTLRMEFFHRERKETFTRHTDALVLATGYKYVVPSFLAGVSDHIQWTAHGYYQVNENYAVDKSGNSLFVQNADLYSHGFNSADLGLGPYRNMIIINSILRRRYFEVEKNNTVQQFGG